MLTPPKPPRKLRKSKYYTEKQYAEVVKEWEVKKPFPLQVVSTGHYITQEYYAENILPYYYKLVQESRAVDTLGITTWRLQEDNDPSHSIKT